MTESGHFAEGMSYLLELAHLWKCDWCIGEIRWLGGDLVMRHGRACAARNPDGSWPPRWPLPRPAPMMTPAGITTPKSKAETRSARAVRLQGEAKALEEQGMRRSDIARQLGVGTSCVSKWLNGSQH